MTRLLALLLATFSLAALPTTAVAQSIIDNSAQTKDEAKQAAKDAQDTASSSDGTVSDSTILYSLGGVGLVLLLGAAWYMLRDAGSAVGAERRAAPKRPVSGDDVGRGAPKAMFTGEGEPGGQVGKRKKRTQGKRQRQARKANRPR